MLRLSTQRANAYFWIYWLNSASCLKNVNNIEFLLKMILFAIIVEPYNEEAKNYSRIISIGFFFIIFMIENALPRAIITNDNNKTLIISKAV